MSALLSPVQDGNIWRVRIVWPNQAVHHYGKFASEQDAIDWIKRKPESQEHIHSHIELSVASI